MKRNVVIIGGGFTGARCAQKLQNSFNVTLIDNKEYFEYTPGILRTIVEPHHLRKIQSKHKRYLPHAIVLNDKVISVRKDQVRTRKNGVIKFDYLVIAAGSSYSPPIKESGLVTATRAKTLTEQFHKLHNAETVLIIGGGLVGVELAAEIVDHYNDKQIVIVHSKSTLIDRNHPKSIKHAQDYLERRGVKIVYGERVKSRDGRIFTTNKGTKIHADTAFICSGIKPNYQVLSKHFKKLINDKHQIQINEHLQLTNHKNIFVGGDVASLAEEKTAQSAERHADYIVHNICALDRDKPLKEYSSKRRPMLISLGKRNGVFEIGHVVITGFIPAFLKTYVEWKTMRKYR